MAMVSLLSGLEAYITSFISRFSVGPRARHSLSVSSQAYFMAPAKCSNIAVVGAGVVGLSTALCIQKSIKNVSVTVIADKFIEETLSFGAGGFLRPDENIAPDYATSRRWYHETLKHFEDLLSKDLAAEAGIKRLSGYAVSSVSSAVLMNQLMKELCVNLRPLSQEQLSHFPAKYKYGISYSSILADPRKYLKWLSRQIVQNGGRFVKGTVQNLEDVGEDFDIVVNCTGLGAKQLTGDFLLTPVRGQAMKVYAPWVTHFFYADGCYILPGTEYITLGGTKQLGDWNLEVSQHDQQYIWETCIGIVPSLKDGRLIQDFVGLRPFRQPIRIEVELLGQKNCKVVHNYGHGAHGVNTSWGTALEATSLVQNLLRPTSEVPVSKL